jgi:hypothetical protein
MKSDEVYVVLTATGTWFSQTIKWFTKAPLNHASLSFDRGLREVYSFGRKKLNNPFSAGFVQENFRDPFYQSAPCAVYRIPVGEISYLRMRRRLNDMKTSPERYKYHLLGLIGVLIRKKIPRENAFFCSHFVASVLEQEGNPPLDKPSHLVTPEDFALCLSDCEIYRGTMSGYIRSLQNELSA